MIGISQDDQAATNHFTQQLATAFPVQRDSGLALSRRFDLTFVPSLFLIDHNGRVLRSHFGFDKAVLNEIAIQMRCPPVAEDFDGAPQSKPGCMSRHLEPKVDGEFAPAPASGFMRSVPASVIEVPDGEDLFEYCFRNFLASQRRPTSLGRTFEVWRMHSLHCSPPDSGMRAILSAITTPFLQRRIVCQRRGFPVAYGPPSRSSQWLTSWPCGSFIVRAT